MYENNLTNWDHSDAETALTLPSKYYYDEALFSLEAKTIHYRTWHCVCHRSEIESPGDFVKFDLLDQSILVVKGESGNVYAYHNVCQHRGTQLIKERRGKIKHSIICPYHAWTYQLDGRLRKATRTDHLKDFDPARISLKSVPIEEVASFYYVNMDTDASPLADDVIGAESEMRRFLPDLDDVVLVNETDYVVDANWKVIVDNAIEGYHFQLSGPIHKQLTSLIDFSGYTLEAHGKWWDFKGPPASVDTAFGHSVAGETYQTDWFYNIQLWPMTTIYAFPYADVIGTFNQIPLGPEKTLLRFGHYQPKSRPQSALSEAVMDWFNNKLGPEDIDLNIAVQKGLRSFGFDQGRYVVDAERGANSEHLLHHFHQLVYHAMHD